VAAVVAVAAARIAERTPCCYSALSIRRSWCGRPMPRASDCFVVDERL
jgi:hypothetical protein